MASPLVIYSQAYKQAKSKFNFDNMVDYINNAHKTEYENKDNIINFDNMVDYIDNDIKVNSSCFNADSNELSNEDLNIIKEEFRSAQEKESNLYQGVFSFDNKQLEELGYYDSTNNQLLNIELFNNLVIKAVSELEQDSRIGYNNMVWLANWHFNTDNVHCHIAYIDKKEQERKDKNKMVANSKCFENMRSIISNGLINNKELQANITNMRDTLRKQAKVNSISADVMVDLYYKIGRKLFIGYNDKITKETEQGYNIEVYKLSNENRELIHDTVMSIINSDEEVKNAFNKYVELLEEEDKLNYLKYGDNYKSQVNDKVDVIITSFAKSLNKEFKEIYNENKDIFDMIDEEKKKEKSLNYIKNKLSKNHRYNQKYNKLDYIIKSKLKYLRNYTYYSNLQKNISYYERNILGIEREY